MYVHADIAVSAPFEEDGMEDGAEGSVYIFLGSGDTYINRAAADGVKYDEVRVNLDLLEDNDDR